MRNKLGLSVYLTTFDNQKDILSQFKGSEYYVFTSFHIHEELNTIHDYQTKAKAMCQWLKLSNFKIIGDVSPKTLHFFNYENVIDFARDLNIDIIRLDYGFSDEEIIEISKVYNIAFNASTINEKLAKEIIKVGSNVFAMHNFYPRPETGLDDKLFVDINQKLIQMGVNVLAFIPGDELKRGPLHEGLPTLEKHRFIPPYVGYLDLAINFGLEMIFIGDIKLSSLQSKLITDYINEKVIKVPVVFDKNYEYLYNQEFTIRIDSPHAVLRLQESREYSCDGELIKPMNTIKRKVGFITIDNLKYKRYSGEIQIVREELPQDERVNVIGEINSSYLNILYCIKNGQKIKFINI